MAEPGSTDDRLDVVVVYPDLLGLYGDRGNQLALVHRARPRGIDLTIHEVAAGDTVPSSADLYLIGGGEDHSMLLAWELVREQRGLVEALTRGATCLAVCAGLQLLSETFGGANGEPMAGLGVLDARCGRLAGERAVGELLVQSTALPIGLISGYENHQGDAAPGPDASPLGRVVAGVGNGPTGTEGVVQGSIVATYLHGPVLVRNPLLADHLLGRALGHELPPWDDPDVERLRAERITDARRAGRRHS